MLWFQGEVHPWDHKVCGERLGAVPRKWLSVLFVSSWCDFQLTRLFYSRMDTLSRIEKALDGLRPYISSHKGTVEVIDYDDADGTLVLRMGGTCHGCAASSITLKKGIEVRLRESVPEVRTVQAI